MSIDRHNHHALRQGLRDVPPAPPRATRAATCRTMPSGPGGDLSVTASPALWCRFRHQSRPAASGLCATSARASFRSSRAAISGASRRPAGPCTYRGARPASLWPHRGGGLVWLRRARLPLSTLSFWHLLLPWSQLLRWQETLASFHKSFSHACDSSNQFSLPFFSSTSQAGLEAAGLRGRPPRGAAVLWTKIVTGAQGAHRASRAVVVGSLQD